MGIPEFPRETSPLSKKDYVRGTFQKESGLDFHSVKGLAASLRPPGQFSSSSARSLPNLCQIFASLSGCSCRVNCQIEFYHHSSKTTHGHLSIHPDRFANRTFLSCFTTFQGRASMSKHPATVSRIRTTCGASGHLGRGTATAWLTQQQGQAKGWIPAALSRPATELT